MVWEYAPSRFLIAFEQALVRYVQVGRYARITPERNISFPLFTQANQHGGIAK